MPSTDQTSIPAAVREDVETLWEYHDMHHTLRPTDLGIGLGSHDLGVATCAARLYHQGMFPTLIFTGANAHTTIERFPRGEAVHYREHALSLGVSDTAILVEPTATNTAENLRYTRTLAERTGLTVRSAILISRPYQQRRAHATALKEWPGVEFLCASLPMSLDDYVASIGDVDRVINMLVGDTQRITLYAQRGFAAAQEVPPSIAHAYQQLVAAGYTRRLLA